MQNKEKFIFKIFALVLAIFSFCCLNFFGTNNIVLADQTSDDFIEISSLDQITDMAGKYRLTQKDDSYTYTASLGNFAGVLDGNGAIISFQSTESFVSTQALFNTISYGAVVYNLCFAPNGEDIQNIYFGAEDEASQKTSYGLLANQILSAQVYGIEFKNTNAFIYDNENLTSVPELNIGLLAGQISGGKIHQIKFENCSILPYQKTEENETKASYIRSNFNIGMVAGKLKDGVTLQNVYVNNPSLTINVAESLSTNNNLGVLVGSIESGYILNNIVDCPKNTSAHVFVNFQTATKVLNFGYLIGKISGTSVSLYNNVLNLKNDTILSLNEEKVFSGLFVGFMTNMLSSEDVQGFVTLFSSKYVGNVDNISFLNTYANITRIDLDALFISKIQDINLWNNIYAWDFDKIWKTSSTNVLPTLQYFEDYEIIFSSVDSVKSLSIEKLPTLSDATQQVVNSEMSANNGSPVNTNTTLNVHYGKDVNLSTKITQINNFDKFFKISGLLLNGEKVFDYDYELQKGVSYNGYQITGEPNLEDGSFNFVISNFTAKNAGTYSVQLVRNVFKLKINVLELDANGTSILPGKIKSNMASDGSSEITVEMQYGTKYTYETYDVNSDYAKEADWYLYNYEPNDTEFVFDLEGRSTNFISQNTLEWTFDENCILWGSGNPEDTTDYLSFNEYVYDKDNPEAENTNIFATTVVFSKDVKDIEIRFKFDDEEEILEKIADVVIDDGAVSLSYVEAEGYYKAKIRFSNKTHIISLKGVSTDYTFDGWYLNSKMPQAINDNYGGTFEILNDGDASTVIIFAVFTKEKVNDGANMLWLWLTLAGVGLLLIVIVIIIVIKKKKAGTSSYKKYMY